MLSLRMGAATPKRGSGWVLLVLTVPSRETLTVLPSGFTVVSPWLHPQEALVTELTRLPEG
ncbi:MAG: hypothetical protein ACP5NF_11270 [Thermoanaerobaculum sp.]